MDIDYIAVTRDSTILAQYAIENGDFDVIVNEIFTSSQIKSPRIQIDRAGYHFFLLHNEKGINVITCCSNSVESDDIFGVLESVYRSFITSYSNEWEEATAFKFQIGFEPTLRREVEIHSNNKTEISFPLELEVKLTESEVSAPYDPNVSQMIDTKVNNRKLKLFISRYKWIFITIAVLFAILIILVVLLMTLK